VEITYLNLVICCMAELYVDWMLYGLNCGLNCILWIGKKVGLNCIDELDSMG
jgi:hypothetical protein